MRPKLPWALLAISLSFNLLFVGGYLYVRRIMNMVQTPEGRVELIADRIGLDDGQKEKCMLIEKNRMAALKDLRQLHNAEIEAFWNEMMSDTPDRNKLNEIYERSWDALKTTQSTQNDYFIKHFQVMNTDQRHKCIKMIRAHNIFVEQ